MADQVSTSDQAPLTDGLGIGLTARAAISLHRGECCGQVIVSELIIIISGQLLVRLFLLALVLSLLGLEWFMEMDTQAAKIYNFYCSHVLVPLLLVIVIQLICNIYSIIAWTRTSLR